MPELLDEPLQATPDQRMIPDDQGRHSGFFRGRVHGKCSAESQGAVNPPKLRRDELGSAKKCQRWTGAEGGEPLHHRDRWQAHTVLR